MSTLTYHLNQIDGPTTVFVLLVVLAMLILWRMHVADDWFDLRDIIAERSAQGKVVSTSKSLLVASFVMTAYWITMHYSEAALAVFTAAWVVNGGIVAWRKTRIESAPKAEVEK